ncbi:MAG: multidrug ABC transporter permease [Candidatus Micrarchaeota archaeon]|nr:MAG: multidrug ABC transporter permease [Candidatus Micrarchaeota archaeon]
MNREFAAIYVLWLRALKRFIRSPSQIIGSVAMPLLFLIFLGLGFSNVKFPGLPSNLDYIDFLVPGILGMSMLFAATTAGISLLWDRQFGFLKEVMVAPVSRLSIMLGRTLGGVTTAFIQSIMLIIFSILIGFKIISVLGLIASFIFMLLIGLIFVSLGLIIASVMSDIQGFGLILNLLIFPLFFLSGALYPLNVLPKYVRYIVYLNPLTYGIDGIRGALINFSIFGETNDFIILLIVAAASLSIGAHAFSKAKIV